MKTERLTIGTRGSKLALWQAEYVKTQLEKRVPGLSIEIKKIKTTGDKILDVPLAQVGGKGLFVKEIEEALLRREADIAVHSMKDVPTDFPDGLHLAVVCKREDPRDALIVSRTANVHRRTSHTSFLFSLPNHAIIGTSSLRRSCQLLGLRPDFNVGQLRGNLDTRLKKLDQGQFDAIVLAAAGLKRLGWHERITEILPTGISLPAIGQGAIGIECRTGDEKVHKLIARLNHPATHTCVKAERAFLRKLEGGCQVPIAAHARLTGGKIKLQGLVGSISGDRIIRGSVEGSPGRAEHLGVSLAEEVLSKGAEEILAEVYKKSLPALNGELSS
jgi:hydroxymethylbilane synthase